MTELHMRAPRTRFLLLALSAALAVTTGAVQAAEPVAIELVRASKPQELSEAARSHIADRLPKLFASCSLNSRDHPQIFVSRAVAAIWQDAQAKDHLEVRLAKPIEMRAANASLIPVQQFLLGLDDPRFPGPELSRKDGEVVAYSKCSGGEVIKFVCAPEVKAVMPSSYHRLCDLIPSMHEESPAPGR